MRQGEIWYANFNPATGSEQAGLRPVVVISGNLVNQHLPIVIIVPLKTKIKNYKGNPVLKPDQQNGLKLDSEMLMFHVQSIAKERLINKIGTINEVELDLALKTLHDIMHY